MPHIQEDGIERPQLARRSKLRLDRDRTELRREGFYRGRTKAARRADPASAVCSTLLEVTGAACDNRRADATNGAPPKAARRAGWCRRRPVHRPGCAGRLSDQAEGRYAVHGSERHPHETQAPPPACCNRRGERHLGTRAPWSARDNQAPAPARARHATNRPRRRPATLSQMASILEPFHSKHSQLLRSTRLHVAPSRATSWLLTGARSVPGAAARLAGSWHLRWPTLPPYCPSFRAASLRLSGRMSVHTSAM